MTTKGRPVKSVQELARSRSERYPANRMVTGTIDAGAETNAVRHPMTMAGGTEIQLQKPMRSDDISILWHELLSPITLIKAYTSTLLQMNKTITGEQQLQYIQGIDSASNRMVRLLENLRDVARLEETRIIRDQTISLLELLQKVLPEMQNQTMKHTIKLHPHAPLPRIRVAPEKIEQVIINLIANAVKYSPNGGDIDVDMRLVRSEPELARLYQGAPVLKVPCYVVSVADNGTGVPEDDLSLIFEKYYRVNNKLVRTSPGAGLGLYICKIIVEAHEGCIWAVNKAKGGSIFSFSLPLDMDKPQGW